MTDKELIEELVINVHKLGPRMRIAISQAEYQQLRLYFLAAEGQFANRIRNILYTIEEEPTYNPLIIEPAQ